MEEKEIMVGGTTEQTTESESLVSKDSEVEDSQVSDQITDDDEDIDFEDSEDSSEEETKEDKPASTSNKPTREQARQYAQQRREKKKEQERLALINEGRRKELSINPYTNERIETDEDLATYDFMKEMEDAGLDPTDTRDYLKYQKEKTQKLEQERIEKEKQDNVYKAEMDKRRETEQEEFSKKYPNVDLNSLLKNNPNMQKIMMGRILAGDTLTEAYELYNSDHNQEVLETAKEIAKKQVQISSAKSPSMQDGDTTNNDSDWKNMPIGSPEFKAYVEKIKRGY